MALVSAICPECHETVKVDNQKPYGFCLNCGAKISIAVTQVNSNTGSNVKDLIVNYFQLATSAHQGGNYQQCESYCNRIIELDATNPLVWALKATSVGWQSSLSNLRIEEMIMYYSIALSNSQDADQRETIQKMAAEDFKTIFKAAFEKQCERFEKWPDKDESIAFTSLHITLNNNTISFITNMFYDPGIDSVKPEIGVMVNNSVVRAENRILQEYVNNNDKHPSKYDFERFIERMGYVEGAYSAAEKLCKNDVFNHPIILKNIIKNHESCMKSVSYKHNYHSNLEYWSWDIEFHLSQEACNYRNQQISELQNRINEIENTKSERQEQIKQECREMYWAEHAEEKDKLLSEKDAKLKQISEMTAKLKNLTDSDEIKGMKKEISDLQAKRETLGIFKGKEKRRLDEIIQQMKESLNYKVQDQRYPFESSIQINQSRVDAIDRELNKEHPEYIGSAETKPYAGSVSATEQRVEVAIVTGYPNSYVILR